LLVLPQPVLLRVVLLLGLRERVVLLEAMPCCVL
jgi:hypothetical protein